MDDMEVIAFEDLPSKKTPLDADNLNKIQQNAKKAIKNRKPTIELLTVSSTAPSKCTIRDKYYNTTTLKIYTAIATNMWAITGENPSSLYLYVDLEHKELYYYNGATFVSYGGGSGGGGDTLPVGSIIAYSSDTIPNGWLLCDGSVVSRTTYSELFNAIGLSYVEEGYEWQDEERFPLPNAKGRTLVGKDITDTDFNTLGKTSGEKTHRHEFTIGQLYSYGVPIGDGFDNAGAYKDSTSNFAGTTGTITAKTTNKNTAIANSMDTNIEAGGKSSTGDTTLSSNLQPSLTLNYIIKAKNTVAIKGDVIQENGTASTTNVYSAKAIDNKLSKSAIVLGYSRHTQSVTSWTDTLITDASVKTQIGNKLTFSNNKVVIGEGVSHIRISAKSSFKKTVSGDCSINVKKNGESIEILDTYESIPANNWYNTAIAPSIIEVSQGDEISLHITLGSSGDVEFLAASYMTIEEV